MRGARQIVGAFGEKAVETELLRRGWLTANVNQTVNNAADYDIFAFKGDCRVLLRVKTCGPDMTKFQFGGFTPGADIPYEDLGASDFTVLVQMGESRASDQFYILLTQELRKLLSAYRKASLNQAKRDGDRRKDIGHWSLYLNPGPKGEDRINYNLAVRWASNRNNWDLLEQAR